MKSLHLTIFLVFHLFFDGSVVESQQPEPKKYPGFFHVSLSAAVLLFESSYFEHHSFQEPAFHKILEEIPYIIEKFTEPINKEIYPTWEFFSHAFMEKGGVVEAYPPSDNTTAISVDVLIEPTGDIQIISQGQSHNF